MDRRRQSYASVAGGTPGASEIGLGSTFRHLTNPSSSSISPSRNSFYPAATASRPSPPYSYTDDNNKTSQTFWEKDTGSRSSWEEREELRLGADSRMAVRPSYLEGSGYLERLDAQHRTRMARRTAAPKTPTLSRSGSGTSLHRMEPSHRGMTYEIVEHIPPETEDDLTPPLPSHWSERDNNSVLDTPGGLEVRYVGVAKSHDADAAATRTNHPIPRRCGIYYYEVKVLVKGKDGMIAAGFSTSKAGLDKLPGWDVESWAYHSDDGKAFGTSASGKHYGPGFGVEDVIGCGLNFRTGKIFFTKNGTFLGWAFSDLKHTLHHKKVFPSVGMKRPGAHIKVNFGSSPFEFDIDKIVRIERTAVRECILEQDISKLHPTMNAPSLVAELITQYLRHDGFISTAESFGTEHAMEAANLRQEKQVIASRNSAEDIHAMQRQRIRSAILQGDIDEALAYTHEYYPAVLDQNPTILFRLKCRKFIEMMRLPSSSTEPEQTIRNAKPKASKGQDSRGLEAESARGGFGVDAFAGDRLERALRYAQELKADYKTDNSKEVVETLNEIYALFAYEDIRNSPAAKLMEPEGRIPVAEGLNTAILLALGAPSTTALDVIYTQTQTLLEDNIDHDGAGAFIHLDRNIDRSYDTQHQPDGDVEMSTA